MARNAAGSVPTLFNLCYNTTIYAGLFATVKREDIPHYLIKRLQRDLLQAVVDDNREFVGKLLTDFPELLIPIKEHLPPVITSRYTHQTFITEPALSIALKRKQVEMVEVIVAAIENAGDKLTNVQLQAIMEQWKAATVSFKSSKERSKYYNFIYFIMQFRTETFDGPGWSLTAKTESELRRFTYSLLPPQINLNNYYDIPELLLTAYSAYEENYRNSFFDTPSQREKDLFCFRIIGGIQHLLPPEHAQILFCKKDAALTTVDHGPIYRSSSEDCVGLGFTYCLGQKTPTDSWSYFWDHNVWGAESAKLRAYVRAKTSQLDLLKKRLQNCLLSNPQLTIPHRV